MAQETIGMDCFIDNDPIMKPQFSPESDNFQGDTTMMESPDSGYRSPQDFTSKLLTNHLGAYSSNEPCLEILEEPIEKFRFRYKSEMAGTHGSLTGINSDRNRKQSYPTVALRNYSGKAIIRCSLYQHNTDEDHRPHAHRLVRKSGNDEIDDPHDIAISEEDRYMACFQNMGIIHTAKKFLVGELVKKKTQLKIEEIKRMEGKERRLNKREEYEIETAANSESRIIDLNIVRLRFDAFTRTDYGALMPLCSPVFSRCINNLKSALTGELKIVRMSRCTSSAKGGDEIFLLVEKVTKKNIAVRFFEEDDQENEIWCDYGKFSEVDVHHQYAIVLKTPPYRDPNIEHEVKVFIELIRKSDNSRSDPKGFTYTPSPTQKIGAKRPRIDSSSFSSSGRSCSSREIPTTIHALTNNLERQSLLNEDFSDCLNIDSEELERIYEVVVPGLPDPSRNLSIDGPVKKINKKKSVVPGKVSLRELELQYCGNVYKEIHALRKTNPQEKYATEFLQKHFTDKSKQPTGNNPLHIIVCNYDPKTQKYFDFFLSEILNLKQFSILDLTNSEKETPLHLAISLGNKEAADKLIIANASVNCKDNNGNTALHLAVKNNNQDIVESIFMYAANIAIDEENNDGDTALNIAIRNGYYLSVVSLCHNGADVNKAHKNDGFTPIRMAVNRSDLKIVRFLIQNANVDLALGDFGDILPIQAAKAAASESNKSECKEIFSLLAENMKNCGFELTSDVSIKEEVESSSEGGDDEPIQTQIKCENLDILKKAYEDVKDFTPAVLEELCKELDTSGSWQYLASLLDLKHFLEETSLFQKEPTKELLRLAVMKGESLYQIREFLENLDEFKAVQIMDNMVYSQVL